MTSILFVDDEPKVLAGLRRMLHGFRREWNMEFAGGGEEALTRLAEHPFDVVVSDMRMPGMDGAQLLTEVKKQHPDTVRIVLSGQSAQEAVFQAIGPAHQYLSKPCAPETLKDTVARAWALRDRLAKESLKKLVSQTTTLPSFPPLYKALIGELQSPQSSIKRVGEIISQDVGMTAKILQLINSSFFGLPQRVSDPAHAVALLGLNLIRALVLSVGIFRQYKQAKLKGFSLAGLESHSLAVATCAERIARIEAGDKLISDDALLAGMLHDVGKLVLAACLPAKYQQALSLAREKKTTLWEAEWECLEASHAEVGGYLLGLWGLPNPIVEAVAFHHQPARCPAHSFGPLAAVHVADALKSTQYPCDSTGGARQVDHDYLAQLGLADRLAKWQEVAQETVAGESRS